MLLDAPQEREKHNKKVKCGRCDEDLLCSNCKDRARAKRKENKNKGVSKDVRVDDKKHTDATKCF